MTLEYLLRIGKLKAHATDEQEITRLLESTERQLRTSFICSALARRMGVATTGKCRYSNYMKRDPLPTPPKYPAKVELKVVQIGNSRGVRLPKAVLERYEIKDSLVLEAREDGLLLRRKKDKRLTWEDTYREAAREKEDWSDFDATLADGIEPGEKW